MKEIVLRSPASVANFGPGFDIFAIALEKPFDILRIKRTNTKSIHINVSGKDEGIPNSAENNTAGLAAIHFFKFINSPSGIDIEIIKRMRSCAGLGSSAASAAACVYGLNKLFGTKLSDNEMIAIASRGEIASGGAAHADNVAACLLGGFVFVRNYEPMDVVKIEVKNIPIVLCVEKKDRVTTRGLIPDHLSLTGTKEQMSFCASLIHALLSGDLKKIGEAVNKDYISEPVRSRFISGYDEIKKKVLESGAYGFNVSGGGSSMFAICEENKTAEVAEIMKASSGRSNSKRETIITRASNMGVDETGEL